MNKAQNIIVATDFSENANRAVEQASALAQAWHAQLALLHVFNDSVWASLKAVYDWPGWANAEDPAKLAQSRLNELAARIGKEYAVPVAAHLLKGRASQQIGQFVAAQPAGLLVIGEHGENWVRDTVLGGTALKVLEAAKIPVLLVRGGHRGLYRQILIATDFSASATRAARLALDLFPDAQHHLLHAYVVPFEASMRMGGAQDEDIRHYREKEYEQAMLKLEAFAVDCDIHAAAGFSKLALYGYPASVLFEQARGMQTDLVAIGKHGGGAFEEKLLGSVTQNVLYHAGCDVLLSA